MTPADTSLGTIVLWVALVTGRDWTPEAEAAWRQKILDFYRDNADEELYCIPSASTGAWLPGPLIEARMTVDAPVLRLELPKEYLHLDKVRQASLMEPFLLALKAELAKIDLKPRFAFGSDFARHVDLSTGSLMGIEDGLKRREVLAYELRNVPGDEQKLIAKAILTHVRHRLVGAAFDATAMGWTVAEDMGRLFGLTATPPAALKEGEISLNASQVEAARLLGISTKDYAAQLKADAEKEAR